MIIFQDASPFGARSLSRRDRAVHPPGQDGSEKSQGDGQTSCSGGFGNMGVSSGECDVGSTKFRGTTGERWTFTASGPSTNLAARLGGFARNGQILVSPETAKRKSLSMRC